MDASNVKEAAWLPLMGERGSSHLVSDVITESSNIH